MQVFDQHHRRPIGRERVEEGDPRLAQALACGEWMQVDRCLQPERQSQNRVSPKAAPPGLPLAGIVPGSANSNAPDTPDAVRSPTTISPGRAPYSRRAAMLTVSPVTKELPTRACPATTSPVFTPIRSESTPPNSSS